MNLERIKGYTWLPMLMVMFLGFMVDRAGATIEAKNQPLPVENDLLQFKAGSHIMGFKTDKVYLVNTAGFLSVEFLGAHTVLPKAATADANQPKSDVALTPLTSLLTPVSGNTLANLQRVEYPGLWDGITLRYDAVKEGISESTYFIQPGADVADIRLKYNADTELQKDGSLKIKLSTQQGYITESKPVAWQVLDGKKKLVQVAYEIKDGVIGFKTGKYDKDNELIIDPTYQWHTFYGSANGDWGLGITVDGSGNVYVAGQSAATWDSPLHAHSGGGGNIVVLKLDSSGTYQWHTFYGSGSNDIGRSIAVDDYGNVYVTGQSGATWGSPLHTHSGGGGGDIVVLKLDSSGTYQWHTFYGSASAGDYGESIAVDENRNIYVTGYSTATWGSPVHAHSGGHDIMALKLNTSGALQWNTFHGSASVDVGSGIVVAGSGNVYVTGYSEATWGSPLHAYSGGISDIVVLNLNNSGTLQWHAFYGSASNDYSFGIALDGSGNLYVTGQSDASWGSPLHTHSGSGNYDIVVFKLNSSGALAWNTFYGSVNVDEGYGIAVDDNENVYVTGSSDATWGSPMQAHSGGDDIMAFKLNSSGTYLWHTFYGSILSDIGQSIAVNGSGNIYITGQSDAWGSPLHTHSGNGNYDIVALKLDPQQNTLIVTKTGTGFGAVSSTPSGIDCGAGCIAIYDENTVVNLIAIPDTGSIFTNWSDGCSGSSNPVSVSMDTNKTCTATFTLNQYALTLNTDGTGAGTVTGAGTYNYGTSQSITATAATGSTFIGWSGDCAGSTSPLVVPINGNKICTATFTLKQYNLIVNSTGIGDGTVTGAGTYNYGTNIILTATPANGSIFIGWSGGGCTGIGDCTVTIDNYKEISAIFQREFPWPMFLPAITK